MTSQTLFCHVSEEGKERESDDGRPNRRAKDSVKYVFMDATSSEDVQTECNQDLKDKSAPSGYRLAAHRYMVARKQGLTEGPRTRTCTLKIAKVKQFSSTDSEATVDYKPDTVTISRKCKPRKRRTAQGQLVTKRFILWKDGKGMQRLPKLKLR